MDGYEKYKKHMMERLATVKIVVKVEPYADVLRRAIRKWEKRNFEETGIKIHWDFNRSSYQNKRLVVNYIRHEMTDYHKYLVIFRTGGLYKTYKEKAYSEIAKAYPMLADHIQQEITKQQ